MTFYSLLDLFLGIEQTSITIFHMSMRGLLIYLGALGLVRFNERFIGVRTQFNFVLYMVLGSLLATAITGNAPFFAVVGMSLVLFFCNLLFTKLSFYSHRWEKFLKGSPQLLVLEGVVQWDAMRSHSITESDILSALRQKGGGHNIKRIEKAFLENNGEISIILHQEKNPCCNAK